MKNKRIRIIILITIILLLIPLIAMQFTDEVHWTLYDFIIAGVLLLGTGCIIDFLIRKIKNVKYRIAIIIAVLIVVLLIWAELAVGIFGTPIQGN
jgi:O-antigen/teichoic acid export membrane protein